MQGIGAAVKLLADAAGIGDLGAGQLKELNRILEGAFGTEIATRIENIAGHIKTLKEELAGATTIGEWMTAWKTFGANAKTELQAIATEIKTNLVEGVNALEFKIKIGPGQNIIWSPEFKSLELPGGFSLRVMPNMLSFEKGETDILEISARPKWTWTLVRS